MIETLLQAERSLTVGQLDAAERLYWQSIENDPKNSIAVVGLARVALERGDERTAYQFARKALEIDPENAAAQRLVARLDEVIAHRGEQPPSEDPPSMPNPKAARPSAAATPGSDAAVGASPGAGSGASPSATSAAITNTPATTVISPAAPRPTTRAAAQRHPAKRRGIIDRILGR